MKIMTKENAKRAMSLLLSFVMAFSVMMPAFAKVIELPLGAVEVITDGLSVEGTEEITVTNKEEITLTYAKADPSIGRNKDGWWAGMKVIAPAGLTEEELKNAKFRKNTDGEWSEADFFWNIKDSADGDAVHWVGIWGFVSPEVIAEAVDNKISYSYQFDWYGNGFDSEVQNINFVLDTEKLVLDTECNYGTATAFTQGIEISGETDIFATNEEEVTLSFHRADPSAYRFYDGWWAGIRVFAPAELTAEQIKNAKYRKWNGSGWGDPANFRDLKDSKDDAPVQYFDSWMMVTPEIIKNDADGKLTLKYEFDWDNNGFGISTQIVEFVLDTTKINLDMSDFIGEAEAITNGLSVEGTEEITVTNKEEITLTYAKADPSIGRNKDGWWAGMKVIAPAGLTEEELKNAKFRKNTDGEWSEADFFWNIKDSADGDAVHWVGIWGFVSPEVIAEAVDNKISYSYQFDWYGNGFDGEVQNIEFVLDTTKINLDMSDFIGEAEAITNGLSVEGTNEITVTNKEEITLTYAKADPSIGRNKDGWWAGMKVIAPAGLTEEELKNVKFRKNTDGQWSEADFFWNIKDSADGDAVHWVGIWGFVSPEVIAEAVDNKISYSYQFDWYGNGFDSEVQNINFVLDTEKLVLDTEYNYGTATAFTQGIEISGETDIFATNEEEVTLSFHRADPSAYRFYDGWWAGIRVFAPAELTAEQIKNAKYRKWNGSGWGTPANFRDLKDSKDDAPVQYFDSWMMVTPEIIKNDADGKLTLKYEFDWDNNGFGISTQIVEFVLDTTKINLDMSDFIGEAEAITNGLSVEGTEEITVTNKEEITLTYAKADPSIGRNKDGWWAGMKVIAPAGLTEEELKNAKFRKNTDGEWSEADFFWNIKDSADGDAVHWVGIWGFVSPEVIAEAVDNKISYSYQFDWYGNGFDGEVQNIEFVLDTTKINLDMSDFIGEAEAITNGLSVEGTEEITVSNKEEITLTYAKADPSIGRNKDGWWAGMKVIAPSGLTEEELKNVKFRKNTDGEWSEADFFWNIKDSADGDAVHWVGIWGFVSPEVIAEAVDNKISYSYQFDWYGNGFDSEVQNIDFVLDTTKINLDHEDHYGSVEAITQGLEASGSTDIEVKNSEEIILDFAHKDDSIGRYKDGWWAGFRINAPAELTEQELKNAKFRKNTDGQWSEAGLFWDVKNSAEGDAVHWVGVWAFVSPEAIAEAEDGFITAKYVFDWDDNGFGISTQEITVKLDVSKIKLIHSEGCTKVVVKEAVAPDCENKGNNEDSYCEVCGLVLGDGKEIPALGHTDGEAVIENNVDPDCSNPGSYDTVVYCTVCSAEVSRDETKVPALGHKKSEEIIENNVDPDCSNPGSYDTVVYCTVCSAEISRDKTTVPALGHKKSEAVTENDVKPDCTKAGSYDTVVYCTVCGAELSRVKTTVKALGHNYSKKLIDSKHLYKAKTCTTYAEYFYGCTRCSDMSSKTFINKSEGLLAHKKVKRLDAKYLVSAADCENPAKYYMGCSGCDTVFKKETYTDGDPMYHFYSVEKVTVKAGINKEGATDFFCKDCGKAFGDSIPFPGIKSIQLSGTSFNYSGKAVTPSVTVKDSSGKTLKSGTDYTVSYSSNTAPGTASVTVTFTGSYTGSKTLKFTINQLPATKKITFTSSTSAIKLTWEKVPNAAGYRVYRKTSKGWTAVGTTAKNTLTVKKLSAGTKYTFMVKACAKVGSKLYFSDAAKSIYTATKAAAPKKIISSQTATSVTLKWSKVSGADGYRVYKYNTKTKKYELYKTIDGTKLTIKKLKSGTSYKYLVRAVTLTADKVKVVGEEKKIAVSTNPAAPKIKVTSKGGTVTVKWNKVAGATGYRVYSMDSKSKELKLIGTLKSNKTSFKKKGFKKGSKTTFAVRAYKNVNGENIFSAYTRKTVKIK